MERRDWLTCLMKMEVEIRAMLFHCRLQYFAEGGVDVYHVAEFGEGGVLAHQYADFLHDVGSMGAIGMAANDALLLVSKELQHAFRLVHGLCFSVGSPE